MRSGFAFSVLTLVGASCASAAPESGGHTTSEVSTSIALGEAPTTLESGVIDAIGIELPPFAEPGSSSSRPDAELPTDSGTTVPDATASTDTIADTETDRIFHPVEIESVGRPIMAKPPDPTRPESVAAFVVAVWANESSESGGWTEAASDWIMPSLSASTRSAGVTAPSSLTHTTVVGSEFIKSDFEARVLVTVERWDPRTGAFSVFAVDVLLVPAVNGWAVAALEFAR